MKPYFKHKLYVSERRHFYLLDVNFRVVYSIKPKTILIKILKNHNNMSNNIQTMMTIKVTRTISKAVKLGKV